MGNEHDLHLGRGLGMEKSLESRHTKKVEQDLVAWE